jgi:hypothetical protein
LRSEPSGPHALDSAVREAPNDARPAWAIDGRDLMKMNHGILLAGAIATALALGGCGRKEGVAEEAGKKVDQAVENAGKKAEAAAVQASEAVGAAGTKAAATAQEVGAKVEAGAKEAAADVGKAADSAGKSVEKAEEKMKDAAKK